MSEVACLELEVLSFLVFSFFVQTMENRETGIGWPLGLGSMYMRLRLVERSLSFAVAEPLYAPSSSFSSFSSASNLDTESTASFFQDNSKTLGRLIGIRPRNRRSSAGQCSRNSVANRSDVSQRLNARSSSEHQDECDVELCEGICIPVFLRGNKMNIRKK